MTDTPQVENAGLPLAQPTVDIEWAAVRSRRDQLLRSTDFTQLPDYPATDAQRAEVTAYRKALRDITQQAAPPGQLKWPALPAFVK
ncbi:phage tail assembly chaperone [Pseudomonas sp. L5B5]|uniref:tail fiber assembly protein n=1 Tax=Pseudomonas sp. L5B5 TaxID=2883205 RepID=UPI001CFABE9B|nr:tail fiber assembly protein [Pseudomonas sp. L5B5]UCZ87116.1 phage tail assembly chaperone [Pseudomonas sp. L5B5]